MPHRSKRKRRRKLSREYINGLIFGHHRLIRRTIEATDAYLKIEGAAYEVVESAFQEVAGHAGEIVALCRAGSYKKNEAYIKRELEIWKKTRKAA